jgi:hypothetical protein
MGEQRIGDNVRENPELIRQFHRSHWAGVVQDQIGVQELLLRLSSVDDLISVLHQHVFVAVHEADKFGALS